MLAGVQRVNKLHIFYFWLGAHLKLTFMNRIYIFMLIVRVRNSSVGIAHANKCLCKRMGRHHGAWLCILHGHHGAVCQLQWCNVVGGFQTNNTSFILLQVYNMTNIVCKGQVVFDISLACLQYDPGV